MDFSNHSLWEPTDRRHIISYYSALIIFINKRYQSKLLPRKVDMCFLQEFFFQEEGKEKPMAFLNNQSISRPNFIRSGEGLTVKA